MDARARTTPTLPVPDPTPSYWQDPPSPLADLQATAALPARADVVVVGSGVSGACVALDILGRWAAQGARGKTLLMLEARAACSGATGRNGGHTKAASYRAFPANAAALGEAEALRIARLEHANVAATHALAAAHGIACDAHRCRTVDVVYDAAQFAHGVAAIEAMRRAAAAAGAAADLTEEYTVVTGPDAVEQRYRTPGAVGAFEYDAGSISAYGFGAGVLALAVARGLQLHAHTPVTALERDVDGRGWRARTPRGTVAADHVVVATNGYTAALLPRFQGVVVPLRGQMALQRPGSKLAPRDGDGSNGFATADGSNASATADGSNGPATADGSNTSATADGSNGPATADDGDRDSDVPSGPLAMTYSFVYADGYEYMVPRPAGSRDAGALAVGGGWATLPDEGAGEFGECDDGRCNAQVGAYLDACLGRYFGRHWGADDAAGRARGRWTGIMGTSADGLPFVGPVPGEDGLWVSVSFDGHGMALCLKCAEALSTMMLGGADEVARLHGWFPTSFVVTETRLAGKFEGRRHAKAPADMLETKVRT